MTNANNILSAGTRVRTIQGELGTVDHMSRDGLYGVRCDGERRIDLWPRSALTDLGLASATVPAAY